jgi:hypothetical protein
VVFNLPNSIYSQELVESVVYELEQYLAWYRDARVQHKVGAKVAPEPTYSAETAAVIKAWFAGQPTTMAALEQLIDHLKNLKVPVVHITLAALPNHGQRLQLVDWFRGLAGRPVLVSFVADRSLGGGVMVRTPNRIFDYSWRQQLIEGRDKIAGIINHV